MRIGPWLSALWREHRLFILVVLPAIALRVDAELGYRWQVWFNDSFQYVSDAVTRTPDPTRPSGYGVFLTILEPLHSYAIVTILQHLLGIAVAVMIYALLRHRFGVRPWLAALAAVPVLYDGFQIQLEHLIMADVPFEFLIVLAATLLLWDPKPSLPRCALIGLLLGLASVDRSVGQPLLAVFAVYMIIRRVSWRGVAATLVMAIIPLLGYSGWFWLDHGQFAMSESTGVFLYSRVMTFAECNKMQLPVDELPLCTTTPPSKRPIAQAYIWTPVSPLARFPAPKFAPLTNTLAQDFAKRAIEAQPLDYAKAVWDDTARVFTWKRSVFPNPATYNEYLFGYKSAGIPSWDHANFGIYTSYAAYYVRGNPHTKVVNPYATFIRLWQRYIWLPGTGYGLILLVGLGGLVVAWRRFGGEALLPWVTSVALIVTPAATAEFDYRYVLPAVPFACLAAAMAFGANTPGGRWLARRRTRSAVAGASDAEHDLATDSA
jgi:hypothetical protein